MSTSLIYHAFGMRKHNYISSKFTKNTIIIKVKTKRNKLRCPCCGTREVKLEGTKERSFHSLPIGKRKVVLKLPIQRVSCKKCNIIRQEKLDFADPKKTYTHSFKRYVLDLTQLMTIEDVSKLLGISWGTIKSIEKEYLQKHYSKPRLKDIKRIAIDEFAVEKGHKYMTVVIDLDTGSVVHVGDGKGTESLVGFWKRLKHSGAKIEAVAMDMSPAYIDAVVSNLQEAEIVFDRFHIVQMLNDKLTELRRDLYRQETDLNKRNILKGTRWLLLKNKENLNEVKDEKKRLEEALEINKPLATAYYLKEELKLLWNQDSMKEAKKFLGQWVGKAFASRVTILKKFANTLLAHRTGIFSWYMHRLSCGLIEGTNNKIKVLKRVAYGYRDMEFFKLKIFAMNQRNYAFLR